MTDPTLIAHRGFAGENPENTIAAIRAAAESREVTGRQADIIEIDVLPTADDDIVGFTTMISRGMAPAVRVSPTLRVSCGKRILGRFGRLKCSGVGKRFRS